MIAPTLGSGPRARTREARARPSVTESRRPAESTARVRRRVGRAPDPPHLGLQLLRPGFQYEALVRSRITGPLEMTSTSITLSADQQLRLALGHNDRLASVPNWDMPTLPGAGALRSTANDMLRFVAATLAATPSPLVSAMSAMLTDRRPTGMPGLDVALAWHIFTRDGDNLIWHNGGTGGYRSFIGFSPKTKVGVVVLSNTSTLAGVDDIGLHVLDARLPTMESPKPHTEIAVDPNLFDGYVGAYQLAPNFVLTVTREANRLFVQATGQPKFEIFAEAAKEYFFKAVDVQLSFVTNAGGQATSVILHQTGANVTGQRIN